MALCRVRQPGGLEDLEPVARHVQVTSNGNHVPLYLSSVRLQGKVLGPAGLRHGHGDSPVRLHRLPPPDGRADRGERSCVRPRRAAIRERTRFLPLRTMRKREHQEVEYRPENVSPVWREDDKKQRLRDALGLTRGARNSRGHAAARLSRPPGAISARGLAKGQEGLRLDEKATV